MNKYLSDKIKVISLICIVAVVICHSYMLPPNKEKFYAFDLFQNIITSSAFRFCLPLFFIISGYLFFFKPFNYPVQIRKRLRTILGPYLLWSLFGASLIYTSLLLPGISEKFNQSWHFTIEDFVRHITIDPIQYQFWFLRDLMILALLSPIIYFLGKKTPNFVILVLALSWVYLGDSYIYFVRIDSILFFSSGAFIALNHSKTNLFLLKFSKSVVFSILTVWLISSILNGYFVTENYSWVVYSHD